MLLTTLHGGGAGGILIVVGGGVGRGVGDGGGGVGRGVTTMPRQQKNPSAVYGFLTGYNIVGVNSAFGMVIVGKEYRAHD